MKASFHLAFPIKDLEATRKFYVDLLGCTIGRQSSNWMDFNFFGNQLTAQVNPDAVCSFTFHQNEKSPFPSYHFGAVLPWREWHLMADHLKANSIPFLIEPKLVFQGEVGEQKILFIEDPNGYFIEFKAFENEESIFNN